MIRFTSTFAATTLGLLLAHTVFAQTAFAQRPAEILLGQIDQGEQLFTQDYQPLSPGVQGDGLGPLFNASSCVACHNQGGVGGGGEAKFNAKSVGIERVEIKGSSINAGVIAQMIGRFHPGFVDRSGAVVNVLPLPHHGGSRAFHQVTQRVLAKTPVVFTADGGPTDSSEVQGGNSAPIVYQSEFAGRSIKLSARLFQRNTTALFGSGLIDQIPLREIEKQFKLQKRHQEISGRPATLEDGRVGRFGWRANEASLVNFVDRACSAELGLRTKRREQPVDPMNAMYRNPGVDISDDEIRAMSAFIAALPRPIERVPESGEDRVLAKRGQKVFQSVGCAVCHTPKLGEVEGLYSDLLLHDMGYPLMDLSHAEPYIVNREIVDLTSLAERIAESRARQTYYGSVSALTMPTPVELEQAGVTRQRSSSSLNDDGYVFVAPTLPTEPLKVLRPQGGLATIDSTPVISSSGRQLAVRLRTEDTLLNQEWRTPPLWGVADSAPYMHDGRASTLLEAIVMHGGEATGTRDRFLLLSHQDREALLFFLSTLVAPTMPPAKGPVIAQR